MGNYRCTKCGETMVSKNPMFRNIFCSDGKASIMTNIVNVVTKKDEVTGRRVVTFEFPYTDCGDLKDLPDDQVEMQCIRNVKGLTEDQIVHWLCDHRWELVGGKELDVMPSALG